MLIDAEPDRRSPTSTRACTSSMRCSTARAAWTSTPCWSTARSCCATGSSSASTRTTSSSELERERGGRADAAARRWHAALQELQAARGALLRALGDAGVRALLHGQLADLRGGEDGGDPDQRRDDHQRRRGARHRPVHGRHPDRGRPDHGGRLRISRAPGADGDRRAGPARHAGAHERPLPLVGELLQGPLRQPAARALDALLVPDPRPDADLRPAHLSPHDARGDGLAQARRDERPRRRARDAGAEPRPARRRVPGLRGSSASGRTARATSSTGVHGHDPVRQRDAAAGAPRRDAGRCPVPIDEGLRRLREEGDRALPRPRGPPALRDRPERAAALHRGHARGRRGALAGARPRRTTSTSARRRSRRSRGASSTARR